MRRFYKCFIQCEGKSPYISFNYFKEVDPLWVGDLRTQKDKPSAQQFQYKLKFRAGFDAGMEIIKQQL